jgi:hypothetical protein
VGQNTTYLAPERCGSDVRWRCSNFDISSRRHPLTCPVSPRQPRPGNLRQRSSRLRLSSAITRRLLRIPRCRQQLWEHLSSYESAATQDMPMPCAPYIWLGCWHASISETPLVCPLSLNNPVRPVATNGETGRVCSKCVCSKQAAQGAVYQPWHYHDTPSRHVCKCQYFVEDIHIMETSRQLFHLSCCPGRTWPGQPLCRQKPVARLIS